MWNSGGEPKALAKLWQKLANGAHPFVTFCNRPSVPQARRFAAEICSSRDRLPELAARCEQRAGRADKPSPGFSVYSRMKRATTSAFALLFALLLAAPAAAQRNRDRDRDDRDQDRGPRETETFDRTLALASGEYGAAQDLLRTRDDYRDERRAGRHSRRTARNRRAAPRHQARSAAGRQHHRHRREPPTRGAAQRQCGGDRFRHPGAGQTKLELRTFSAPLTVTGVRGDLIVDGFSSDIRLTNVGGPMRVKTFSGGVEVEAQAWTDGDDLNVNTFSGGVTLRLPACRPGSHRVRYLQRPFQQRYSAVVALSHRAAATSAAR